MQRPGEQLDEPRLDEYQQAAAKSDAQYLQIVGYPGTGKTMVLANRIARLIEDGTPPRSIVALTFTKSSCLSLRQSISRSLPPKQTDDAAEVHINTYHSFCQDLIERFPEEVGISGEWRITDFLDIHNVLHYPKLATGRGAGQYPHHLTPEQRSRALQVLRDYKAYDFDQALDYGQRIIKARKLGVSHLVIDEFQDCTSMQWDLVRTILEANPDARLTVAGDPNQEIFNFQPGHLESAFDTMQGDRPTTQTLYLRYNYRSTQQIIDTFQAIISQYTQAPRKLVATVPGGEEPQMMMYATPDDEAEGVRDLVEQLGPHRAGYNYADIAILLRTNSEVQRYMDLLRSSGIPVHTDVEVRSFGVQRRPSVALTLMKWAHTRKDFYLAQLLYNRYHKFVSVRDFEALAAQPPELVARPLQERLLAINPKKYQHPFLSTYLPGLRTQLLDSKTPGEVADIVVDAVTSWKTMAGTRAASRPQASDTTAWQHMLEALKQCAENIKMENLPLEEQTQRGAALAVVLRHIFSGERPLASSGGVSVATVHSAKSKEWPVVVLPSGFAENSWWMRPKRAENIRLQYVAASRAQKMLYFANAGPIQPQSRNSFVDIGAAEHSLPGLSLAAAIARDPLVFKPIHAIRRLSRMVKM